MSKVIRKQVTAFPNMEEPISYEEMPVVSAQFYQSRLDALLAAMKKEGLTHVVIYADREHYSNMEFLTGFDPRFEEAILIVADGRLPMLVVGNEGDTYADKIPYHFEKRVFPTFSLPGQPRNGGTRIEAALQEMGVTSTSKIGVIGWKWFDAKDYPDYPHQYDLPFFIMQDILKAAKAGQLQNATHLMIDNTYGLRVLLDEKELVMLEIAGTRTSRNVLRVLQNLSPGMTELEASEHLRIAGDPLSVHANVNFGENNFLALNSPTTTRRLQKGDLVGVGMAYRRSLCHKMSLYAPPSGIDSRIDHVYDTYFRSIAAWYESLKDGASSGDVYSKVEQVVGPLAAFGIGLNPGHLIHTEEWTNTPFYSGSTVPITSGMAIQCDFTAVHKNLGIAVHAEDGVIIANKDMRARLAQIAPQSYSRMQNRQKFVRNILGINISDDLLPTSDIPAVYWPGLCDIHTVLAME